jgi:hypothetical protein
MDPRRFDAWSKALAARRTRRQALATGSGAALIGLLGSLTRSRAQQSPGLGLGEDGICRLRFQSVPSFGPSVDSGENAPRTGLLEFAVGEGGGITDGRLTLDSGEQYSMIGHATGRYFSMRFDMDGAVLIAIGAGERNVRSCEGAYGGPTSGPLDGDLGGWSATAGEAAASSAPSSSGRMARAFQDGEPGLSEDGICRLEFESTVRVGASRLGGDRTAVTRGTLELDIGDNGGIGEGMGRLVLENGQEFPVLGQAPGQSVTFRIDLDGQTLIGVGVGNERTSDCLGVYSGRAIGPAAGDLGDWTASGGQASPVPRATPSGASVAPGTADALFAGNPPVARLALAQDDDLGGADLTPTETATEPAADETTTAGADDICQMEFTATVRTGPTLERGSPATLTGRLSFRLGEDAEVVAGESQLEADGGNRYPVTGQTRGRAVSLRINLGPGSIVAMGTAERPARSCAGEIRGFTAGPLEGDLGDWVARAVSG